MSDTMTGGTETDAVSFSGLRLEVRAWGADHYAVAVPGGMFPLAVTQTKERAAELVRRWNAHEELVAALGEQSSDPTRCTGVVKANGKRCVADQGHEGSCRDWGAGPRWREREEP